MEKGTENLSEQILIHFEGNVWTIFPGEFSKLKSLEWLVHKLGAFEFVNMSYEHAHQMQICQPIIEELKNV